MKCENCGATISPRDIELGSCGFCESALTSAVDEAAKQAALAELLADHDGDGVPDALQAMQKKQREQQERDQLQAKLAALRTKADAWENARARPANLVWLVPLGTLVLGTFWFFIVAGVGKSDPWLGLHHRTTCSEVCKGCTGPYVFYTWGSTSTKGGCKSNSFKTHVYCRHPSTKIGSLGGSKMYDLRGRHEKYELPGGMTRLWWGSLLLWLLPTLGLFLLLMLRIVRNRRAAVPKLRQEIESLEQQLER